jgi:hypothetical protein
VHVRAEAAPLQVFFRADPILRTSDTRFSLTEIRPVPWPDPPTHQCGAGVGPSLEGLHS